MPDWRVIHACLERGPCLSREGYMSVWRGVHVCLERGPCLLERNPFLSGEGSMPV